ncbi:MAG: SDR family NAD(P)-dependent oxidoreductase, partial [Actinomycetota bacterium]
MRIEGKVALVTGGASGLGLAAVEELVSAGGSAVVLDLPSSNGETVAKELGDRARFAPADVTNEDEVRAAVGVATEAFGGLHIVVNCAGVGELDGWVPVHEHSLDAWERTIAVNTTGPF